jgi:Mg/Co/Ni transporter MgtE
LRLKLVSTRLRRLHPAQIADLVEAASHDEGQEIMEAVGSDKELEADVFEELDDEHQVEFLRERSDEQVADVLGRMASDDAADLLLEIQQERRIPVLNLLPVAKQRKIMGLLGYNPSTAGGLMNPDFVSVPLTSSVSEVLAQVRASALGAQQITTVCVVDEQGVLIDTVSLAELVRAEPGAVVSSLTGTGLPSVYTEADLPDVAQLMADFNLIAMPVVDHAGMPVGLISVDDVLELLVPEEWRRRAGVARD